jgi:hypothetical protein
MDEMTETTTGESTNLIGKFSQLPGGVQRIIIAVLLIVLIVAAFFLQRLIRAEEDADPEIIPFESAAAFEAEV